MYHFLTDTNTPLLIINKDEIIVGGGGNIPCRCRAYNAPFILEVMVVCGCNKWFNAEKTELSQSVASDRFTQLM